MRRKMNRVKRRPSESGGESQYNSKNRRLNVAIPGGKNSFWSHQEGRREGTTQNRINAEGDGGKEEGAHAKIRQPQIQVVSGARVERIWTNLERGKNCQGMTECLAN